MSDAKAQSEPSMEEILATLSHIIAEDKPAGATAAAGGEEEILDLTEAVGADGSVRHLSPHAGVPASERIVSAATSGTAASALAQMAAAARQHRREGDVPIGGGERSLEDLVRDMLRPMLQTWLDRHLAGLVERLVREEIARIAGEAGLR